MGKRKISAVKRLPQQSSSSESDEQKKAPIRKKPRTKSKKVKKNKKHHFSVAEENLTDSGINFVGNTIENEHSSINCSASEAEFQVATNDSDQLMFYSEHESDASGYSIKTTETEINFKETKSRQSPVSECATYRSYTKTEINLKETKSRQSPVSECATYSGFDSFLRSFQIFPDDEEAYLKDMKTHESEGEDNAQREASPEREVSPHTAASPNQEFEFTDEEKDYEIEPNISSEYISTTMRNEFRRQQEAFPFKTIKLPWKNREILFFRYPFEVQIKGYLEVTLVSGNASLYGYELKPLTPVTVYSIPKTGLLSIYSLPKYENQLSFKDLIFKLSEYTNEPAELPKLIKSIYTRSTVVVMLEEVLIPSPLRFLQLYEPDAIPLRDTNKNEIVYALSDMSETHSLTFHDDYDDVYRELKNHLYNINPEKPTGYIKSGFCDISGFGNEDVGMEQRVDASREEDSTNKKAVSEDENDLTEKRDISMEIVDDFTKMKDVSSEYKKDCTRKVITKELLGSRIIISGGIRTGKSVLLRYLVNKFLNKYTEVFYLETDPGHPEFTPPGLVSLTRVTEPILGPSFTHLRDPEKMIFTGALEPESSPPMHVRSLKHLMDYFDKNYPNSILFINTAASAKGLGELFLQVTKNHTRPTVDICISDDNFPLITTKKNNVLQVKIGFGRNQLMSISRGEPSTKCYQRWSILSHLGQCQKYFLPSTYINAMRPVCVRWDDVAVYNFNKKVPYNRLYEAMNGSIVALCKVEDCYVMIASNPEYPSRILDDEPHNECLGYGLVRAVDETKHLFYIVTPIDLPLLSKVNALINGDIIVPSSVILKQPIYDRELLFTNQPENTDYRKAHKRHEK